MDGIREIAESVGATRYRKSPPLSLSQPNAVDDASIAEARQLLSTRRKASSSYSDPTRKISRHFKRKKKIGKQLDTTLWKYFELELRKALQYAIDQHAPIPVVAALLKLGATIDFQKTLPRATLAWQNDLIGLLLNHRGPQDIRAVVDTSLDTALNELVSNEVSQPDASQLAVVSDFISVGANVRNDLFEKPCHKGTKN